MADLGWSNYIAALEDADEAQTAVEDLISAGQTDEQIASHVFANQSVFGELPTMADALRAVRNTRRGMENR